MAMKHCTKIDKSLSARYGIVSLLESLKNEDITITEMEKIGTELQKEGRRALPPLLRKLWREQNGDHISRYVYLLDFFEDEVWIDQLIRIALKRHDLEEDGKAVLLGVLEEYGVDITAPPFARLLEELNSPLEQTVGKLLEKGEAGLIRFMEDFLCYSQESRLSIVRHLARVTDPRVFSILEILLRFDEAETVRETIATLGKIRDERAASLLRTFLDEGSDGYRELVVRNLRRLAFLGITPGAAAVPEIHARTFQKAAASSIDGVGNRTIWFSSGRGEDSLDVLVMQIHETKGMLDALGYSAVSREKHDKLLQEVSAEEALLEIEPHYAALLISDALSRNREKSCNLPPEFYVRQRILPAEALVPAAYMPVFAGYDLNALAAKRDLVAQSATLFEEEYFDGWFTADNRLFDLAEEFSNVEKESADNDLAQFLENFIKRFVKEQVTTDLERLSRRLFLIADLMLRTCRDRGGVEKTLAVALSFLRPGLVKHKNPFLRQFALESLKITKEALAEGFDIRLQLQDWQEDGENWDE